MNELHITSSIDGSVEPSLFYKGSGEGCVPLVVGLHAWSHDRFNQVLELLPRCQSRGWALLLPEFRGPNLIDNSRANEACASKLARQDVIDAVNFVQNEYPIDRSSIFLVGGSGGGHMALMMAGYAPTMWRAVSAWCPITDLAAWHGQNPHYSPHIAACCGGEPGSSASVDAEYTERSPISHARMIAQANVFIHHGRFDQSVPYSHTLDLIQKIEEYGSKNFLHEIFDGDHEIRYDDAFRWFDTSLGRCERGA